MGLLNLFKLEKLKIQAFKEIERKSKLIVGTSNEIEAQYNPESLTTKHANNYQAARTVGPKPAPARWLYSGTSELTVKLIFDGTQVGHFGIERLFGLPTVAEQIARFLQLCFTVVGDKHEPAYLRLIWGSNGIFGKEGFDCRSGTVDILYTLFDRDGAPLRAELTVKFIADPEKQAAKLRLSSPDLTHHRVVLAGDTLPLLCREIYGSAEHYLRVAQVNGLDDFRDLEPGSTLIFPPLARPRKEHR